MSLLLNLQLFSEEPPAPVFIDVNDDDDDNNPPPGSNPLPVGVVSTAATPNPNMPSALAAEAWRNVEELLVTLSNNVRVNSAQQREDISQLREETVAAIAEIRATVSRLSGIMEDFVVLMENATVEVPAPQDPEPKPKSRGYFGRKG